MDLLNVLQMIRDVACLEARLNEGTMHYGEWTEDNSAPYSAITEVIDQVIEKIKEES